MKKDRYPRPVCPRSNLAGQKRTSRQPSRFPGGRRLAALYCNARSRKAGLDTVYAYPRMEKTQTGRVYSLEGLAIPPGLDSLMIALP